MPSYQVGHKAAVALLLFLFSLGGVGATTSNAQSDASKSDETSQTSGTDLFSGSTQNKETWEAWVNRVQYARKLYTTGDLNLRAGPSTRHRAITTMPLKSKVWVTDCEDGWCHLFFVSVSNATGFVGYASEKWIGTKMEAVSAAIARQFALPETGYPSQGEGYINTDGDWVPSPRHSDDGPPAGATAVCADGTYSFSRHRRGTCSHHGGVARWLP
jgi:uncharacterized protein YraI